VVDDRHATRRAQLWLGTLVEIAVDPSSCALPEVGIAAAFAAIARIHRELSLHNPQSELSRVNRNAPAVEDGLYLVPKVIE